jgi:hypothetical protein
MAICKRCDQETVGKSKYCLIHREEARIAFKAMLDEQGKEKAERMKHFEEILALADAKGRKAAEICVPEPMIVVQHENPWDTTSEIIKEYPPVMDGVCGFAWITIKPANSAFANFLKKREDVQSHKGYYGGLEVWVRGYGQSMARKEAYARAFAAVLRENGINARAESRMD